MRTYSYIQSSTDKSLMGSTRKIVVVVVLTWPFFLNFFAHFLFLVAAASSRSRFTPPPKRALCQKPIKLSGSFCCCLLRRTTIFWGDEERHKTKRRWETKVFYEQRWRPERHNFGCMHAPPTTNRLLSKKLKLRISTVTQIKSCTRIYGSA